MLFYGLEVFFATYIGALYDGTDQVKIGVDSELPHSI
jgi:hypothetical protein